MTMDERLMKNCVGKPVPEWDLEHRLPIDRPAGPITQDFGAIFRINSIYMDVAEPSLFEKHWFVTASILALLPVGTVPYEYAYTHAGDAPEFWVWASNILSMTFAAIFGGIAIKLGRGFIYGLRRRPIRFHRGEGKLYAMRKRRFFAKRGDGDVVWEVPWSADSIFCLHRERSTFGELFHIRHYSVDDRGNVTQVFSIGREWKPAAEVEMALAQWNYWCKYMSDGPSDLPKPMLFHTENETPRESFLFSLYGVGMRAPVAWRIVMMPFVLVFTAMRILANATCRDPVWPESIEAISRIAPDDPYAEPRANTPVGWAETILAQRRGEYPEDPNARVDNWSGEPDGRAHAAAWLDNPTARAAR